MLIINKKVKAFTLLELIVVIAIISILAVIAVPSFTKSLAKARDAKRVADIRIITDALYKYQVDGGKFIQTQAESDYQGWGLSSKGHFVNFLSPQYLNKIPTDPINNSNTNEGYTYSYACYKKDGGISNKDGILLTYKSEISGDIEHIFIEGEIDSTKCIN